MDPLASSQRDTKGLIMEISIQAVFPEQEQVMNFSARAKFGDHDAELMLKNVPQDLLVDAKRGIQQFTENQLEKVVSSVQRKLES